MATHFRIPELITLHNNIAHRKGAKQIPIGTKMSFDQIADRIQALEHVSIRRPPFERRHWLLKLLHIGGW